MKDSTKKMEKVINLLNKVSEIAAKNPEGFTFNVKTLAPQNHGYAVALAETQNSFGKEGLLKVINYVLEHNIECIGGWLDSETDLYYFDATAIVYNLDDAITLGLENRQIAIFDLDGCKEIFLPQFNQPAA